MTVVRVVPSAVSTGVSVERAPLAISAARGPSAASGWPSSRACSRAATRVSVAMSASIHSTGVRARPASRGAARRPGRCRMAFIR